MRFLGLGLANTVPGANTIWTYREALTRAKLRGKPATEILFKRFDAALVVGRVSGKRSVRLSITHKLRLRAWRPV